MGNPRKKKILLLAGSTYIFIIGSLLILISLVLVVILFGYPEDEPESSTERVVRKRPALITFDDPTATPIAEVDVASGQTAQPGTDIASDTTITNVQTGPSSTLTPISNLTTNLLTPSPTATIAVTPLSSMTPTPTPTPTLTPTPTPTSSPSATPTPTLTNTPSPTLVPGRITGRVLLNGSPAVNVTVKLEDQSQNTIAKTVVAGDGTYSFSNLTASAAGYNLVFAQEWNTQYPLDQVISWGWLGPIPVADGNAAQMPDFDISLLGFEPTTPAPNASFSATSISSSAPIQFQWSSYPSAARYWVDLARGQDQTIVWQAVAQNTSLSFDGTLSSGSQIQPGEYWWGVGARRDLGTYKLTVYGYLPVLLIVP